MLEGNNKNGENMSSNSTKKTEGNPKQGCGCLIVILIVIIAIGFGVYKHNVTKKQKAEAVKQEQITKQKQAAQEKKEEEAIKVPVINFTGKIDPSIAKVGDKVVIAVTIENTDSKKTIKGIQLLFSNKSFISEGLTVVNIMNGGQQDGRSFIWSMEIPPKESRTFNSMCCY